MSTGPLRNVISAQQNMAEQGGAFARAIAEAWVLADSANGRRLEEAFRDLFVAHGAYVTRYRLNGQRAFTCKAAALAVAEDVFARTGVLVSVEEVKE